MRGVEFLVILAVTALHLAIMSGRIRANQLVTNTETRQLRLKQRGCISALWQKALCKFCAVVCLYALNGVGKSLNHVPEEHSGGICIIHQIRNSTKYVSYKDLKALVAGRSLEIICSIRTAFDRLHRIRDTTPPETTN